MQSQTTQLTEEHLDFFKGECMRLIQQWELMDWELAFELKDKGDLYARTEWHLVPRTAVFTLNSNYPDTHGTPLLDHLHDVAKHEVIHLLLAPLQSIASARWATQDEYDAAEHAVLAKLKLFLLDN